MEIKKYQKWTALVLVLCILFSMTGCADEEKEAKQSFSKEDTWVVYWYLCGSDLESNYGAATADLNEMMQVKLPENVKVVIQTGGASKWQNDQVKTDRIQRYEYSGDTLTLKDETEQASMGDPETLKGFLNYAEENYPADHKMLLFWNHGGGGVSGVSFDENYEMDSLVLDELSAVMKDVYGDKKPFEVVGFDTCLMATVDTANVFQNYASYMVASEETEPGNGWLYSGWLSKLAKNPAMNGAELGKEICDSFKQGCKQAGTDAEITLSVTDLSKTPAIIEALQNMGKVVLKKAEKDSSVCAEFARSATKAENYGGNNDKEGYTNMVDLGHLAQNAEGLIGESKAQIEKALSDAIVYKINGDYRRHASGLSVYYSYDGDQESAARYQQIAAENIYSSFVNYSIGANISDEALSESGVGEVQEVSGFDGDLEMSINENDYIQLNIDPAKLDSIQSIAFNFAYISDDGKAIVFLGKDNDLECDWEKGVFQDNFRGVWGSINDRECYMELVYEGDDYNLYTVPIKLNGEDSYLSVAYDYEAKDFYILGATSGVDESGQAGKDMRPLEKGDKVAIVYYAQSLEGDDEIQEMPDEEFSWKESYQFKEKDLPDGKYAFTYEVTDITGKSTMSDVAFLNLKNGEIKPEL